MGTHMAPFYADLLDIFALYRHREETLKMLLEHLNQAHPTIKFTADWSRERVNFLDVTVKLEHGTLTTDLHVKPADTHQ